MKLPEVYLTEDMLNDIRGDIAEFLRVNDEPELADEVGGLSDEAIADYYEYMLTQIAESIVKEGA